MIPLKFKGCTHAKYQYDVSFISGLVEKLARIHEIILLVSRGHVSITNFPSLFKCFTKRNDLCFQFLKACFRCLHFFNVLVLVRLINTLKIRITRNKIFDRFRLSAKKNLLVPTLKTSHAQNAMNSENFGSSKYIGPCSKRTLITVFFNFNSENLVLQGCNC